MRMFGGLAVGSTLFFSVLFGASKESLLILYPSLAKILAGMGLLTYYMSPVASVSSDDAAKAERPLLYDDPLLFGVGPVSKQVEGEDLKDRVKLQPSVAKATHPTSAFDYAYAFGGLDNTKLELAQTCFEQNFVGVYDDAYYKKRNQSGKGSSKAVVEAHHEQYGEAGIPWSTDVLDTLRYVAGGGHAGAVETKDGHKLGRGVLQVDISQVDYDRRRMDAGAKAGESAYLTAVTAGQVENRGDRGNEQWATVLRDEAGLDVVVEKFDALNPSYDTRFNPNAAPGVVAGATSSKPIVESESAPAPGAKGYAERYKDSLKAPE